MKLKLLKLIVPTTGLILGYRSGFEQPFGPRERR